MIIISTPCRFKPTTHGKKSVWRIQALAAGATVIVKAHNAHPGASEGPFPASSDSRFTSVGMTSIERFLRPVSYQGFPDALLPEALRESNSLGLPRSLDGQ